jgi:integrase
MANWFRRPGGAVVIQFSGLDKRKRTLSLGEASDGTADRAFRVVKSLVDAARYAQPVPPDVAAWLDALPDETYARFVVAGLVNAREKRETVRVTVAAHAEAFITRRTDIKPASLLVYRQVVRNLAEHFGETLIADVTPGDCDDFARFLMTTARSAKQVERQGAALSPATCGKRLQLASTIFGDAQRRGLISSNPFADVKKPGAVNIDRQQYVPAESVETLIEAEPDPEWRLLLALARYLGLRTPSEPFSLTWDCIDWEKRRIRINSPKTEVHGKPYRTAPIPPEVLAHLERLYTLAPEGAVYVLDRLRQRDSVKAAERGFWAGLNLRTALLKKIERAGLTVWPRLWHALRASAETDLVARFPVHVVAGWLGNTPTVATKHYLMTTDADFDRAASETALPKALLSGPEKQRIGQRTAPGNAKNPVNTGLLRNRLEDRGFEPLTSCMPCKRSPS